MGLFVLATREEEPSCTPCAHINPQLLLHSFTSSLFHPFSRVSTLFPALSRPSFRDSNHIQHADGAYPSETAGLARFFPARAGAAHLVARPSRTLRIDWAGQKILQIWMLTGKRLVRIQGRRCRARATIGLQPKFCAGWPRHRDPRVVWQYSRRMDSEIKVCGGGTSIDARTKPVNPAMSFDLLAPAQNVVGIESDAKDIGRNESRLRRFDCDITNQNAVDPCDHPPLPAFLAQEDGGTNCQHTGDIVESKHYTSFHFGETGLEMARRTHRQHRRGRCSRSYEIKTAKVELQTE